MRIFRLLVFLFCWAGVMYPSCFGQSPSPASLKIEFGGADSGDLGIALQLLAVMTILTLAPSMVMLMTSFTRIVIVLGFLRNALGVQQSPSNQILIGISIFLTIFLMAPISGKIYDQAIQPYIEKKILSTQALEIASHQISTFMLKQTRPSDVEFFLGLAQMGTHSVEQLPLRVVIPAFVLSELRTAFQMGFLIFIPFIVIDFLVACVLMGMGMMMMPPVVLSLPFKLLLFVLVDGWSLIVKSLVQSFRL